MRVGFSLALIAFLAIGGSITFTYLAVLQTHAAVILTDDGVVVVDSHSKPSAARAVYKEIQAVTNKPVRKIINTHFHWDHWQGNQAYKQKFPNLEIITSERTRTNLTSSVDGSGGIGYVEKQLGPN